MHLVWRVEALLGRLLELGAEFRIVFFPEHVALWAADPTKRLAREALLCHLRSLYVGRAAAAAGPGPPSGALRCRRGPVASTRSCPSFWLVAAQCRLRSPKRALRSMACPPLLLRDLPNLSS